MAPCCGEPRFTTTAGVSVEFSAFRRELRGIGRPRRLMTFPAPTAEEIEKKVLPFLEPLQRWEVSQPGMCCACSNAADEARRDREPDIRRGSGEAGNQAQRARIRYRVADRSSISRACRRLDCSIHCCRFPGRTIIPGTIAPAAAADATWSMRTIDPRIIPAHPRSTAIWGRARRRIRPFRTANLAIRFATVHTVHSVQPVHGLSHPSGHEHGSDVLRLYVVGQRNGREVHVAHATKAPEGRGTHLD